MASSPEADLVGRSRVLDEMLVQVRRAQSLSGANVLLTGECGSGRELVARAIHRGSAQVGPFVSVNCVMPDRWESETGKLVAGVDSFGWEPFERARGGVLFLDEVAALPLAFQGRLARLVEVVSAAGAAVRVIAASQADLRAKIGDGTFRQDLYYRLMHMHIRVPALRDRLEDLSILVPHYIKRLSAGLKRPIPRIGSEALERLMAHAYPGNLSELKNTLERAVLFAEGDEIKAKHIVFIPSAAPGVDLSTVPDSLEAIPEGFPYNLAEAEERLIERALQAANGNVSAAARLLGINRTRIYRRQKIRRESGLDAGKGRAC